MTPGMPDTHDMEFSIAEKKVSVFFHHFALLSLHTLHAIANNKGLPRGTAEKMADKLHLSSLQSLMGHCAHLRSLAHDHMMRRVEIQITWVHVVLTGWHKFTTAEELARLEAQILSLSVRFSVGYPELSSLW